MSGLTATAEHFLVDRIVSNAAPLTGKSKAGLGFFALAGFLLCVALTFFIYGGYIWLNANYSAEIAAIAIGMCALFLAIISSAAAYGVIQYRRYRFKQLKGEVVETINMALEIADEELGEPVRKNPKTAVLVASLAGFIAGEKFI